MRQTEIKKSRAMASEAGTGGIQQTGNTGALKHGETPTKTLKRPRSEGSTATEMAKPPKRLRDLQGGSGQYKHILKTS
jgi:hypothetical protein